MIFAAPHVFKTPREEKESCLGSNDQCFPLFPRGSGGETGDITDKVGLPTPQHNLAAIKTRTKRCTYKKLKATNYFVEALPVYVFGQTNVASTTKRGMERFPHLDRDSLFLAAKKAIFLKVAPSTAHPSVSRSTHER